MKNKGFYKLLKKDNSKFNTGFTLTELLVGIIIGGIVVGGLGWGLLQILKVTQVQTSKSKARLETSRAFSFISDEMRRAQSIEVDTSSGNLSTADNPATTDINEEVAPSFALPVGGRVVLALNIPNVPQRVIYYIDEPPTGSVWRGPQVVYRWGPAFDANGNYTVASLANPGGWQDQALIDKVDDVTQNADCDGDGTGETPYKGFYACVLDDDGDTVVENADSNGDGFVLAVARDVDGDGTDEAADTATADINGDGVTDSDDLDVNQDGNIDREDNADADGLAITAQLFFTGGTDALGTDDDGNYAAQTQVVARSRVAPNNNSDSFTSYTMSFKSLGAAYGCKPGGARNWLMRTDFINNALNPDDTTGNNNAKWVYDETEERQPQPIKIDTDNNLLINSVPVPSVDTDCISRGGLANANGLIYENESLTNGDESLYYNNGQDANGNYIYTDALGNVLASGAQPVFKENSDINEDGTNDDPVFHRVKHEIDFGDPTTYNGYKDGNDDKFVGNGNASNVLFLRPNDVIPDTPGYDPDAAGTTYAPQDTLRAFLFGKGYADASGNVINIEKNERIVVFELGHTDTTQPGFDRQDNIFILTSDVFGKDAPTP